MLSIIIPVYNAQETIRKCVQSIEKSVGMLPYELLLVDDGSEDSSLEICRKLSEKNDKIKVFQKDNEGPASARNMGIREARGDYLVFSDADDLWNDSFHDVWNKMSLSDDIDLVVSPIYRCTKEAVACPRIEEICCGCYSTLPDYFFFNGLVHTSCGKIYKSSIIKDNNICFPDYRLSEDSLFNIKYLSFCRNVYLDNQGYYVYLFSKNDSLTGRIHENAFQIYALVEDELRQYFIKKNHVDYQNILNSTMFPQFYGTILKVLKSKTFSSKEKRKLINKFKQEYDVDKLLKSVKHESRGERMLCNLIVHRLYFLASVIVK